MKNLDLKKKIQQLTKYHDSDEYKIYIACWNYVDECEEIAITIDLVINGDYENMAHLDYHCKTWEEVDNLFDKIVLPEIKKREKYLKQHFECEFEVHKERVLVC